MAEVHIHAREICGHWLTAVQAELHHELLRTPEVVIGIRKLDTVRFRTLQFELQNRTHCCCQRLAAKGQNKPRPRLLKFLNDLGFLVLC